jgi:CRISPR/Cas system-associated protein endoribonuclease Cas2
VIGRIIEVVENHRHLSVYRGFLVVTETTLPEGGKVNILQFSDKQYERIISFYAGKSRQPTKNLINLMSSGSYFPKNNT